MSQETRSRAISSCTFLANDIAQLEEKLAHTNLKEVELRDFLVDRIAKARALQKQLGCLPATAQFSGHTVVGPGAASSGNIFVFVVVDTDGRVFYNWSVLGGQPTGWIEIPNAPRTDAAPAVALVGNEHNYLFVVLKAASTNDVPDGQLFLAQGTLSEPFNPWMPLQ